MDSTNLKTSCQDLLECFNGQITIFFDTEKHNLPKLVTKANVICDYIDVNGKKRTKLRSDMLDQNDDHIWVVLTTKRQEGVIRSLGCSGFLLSQHGC